MMRVFSNRIVGQDSKALYKEMVRAILQGLS